MFKSKTYNSLNFKDIYKKINYELKSNFFDLDEFKSLSFRKAYKVIKLISKIKKIKLKRLEIKEITHSIQNIDRKTKSITIKKLFNWFKNEVKKTKERTFGNNFQVFSFVFLFRKDREKILRN